MSSKIVAPAPLPVVISFLLASYAVAGFGARPASAAVDPQAIYSIVGVQSGKCVDVAGASLGNAVALEIQPCNGAPSQQFRFEAIGSGTFRLRNVNSGRCADVASYSFADGAAVNQYTCGTGQNQQWSFTDLPGGAVRIAVRHSGKVLDVAGQSTADGTPMHQWASNNQANQQFRLVIVGDGASDGGAGQGGGGAGDGGRGGNAGGPGGGGGSGGRPAASGGAGNVQGTGGRGAPGGVGTAFDTCRFHFGTNDGIAKNNATTARQLDLFTPGWMGTSDTFNMKYVCDETSAGGPLAAQVPAIVAYVAAFYAKRHDNLKDCNAPGPQQDLCALGADYVEQHLSEILAVYDSYARGFAGCYGTTRPIIFMMEPDFYQYTGSRQSRPWTAAHAGEVMSRFVRAVKAQLPNAIFSLDISPWVAPNNGADNGRAWYANFDMSLFTFIHTSGGGTDAASVKIRASNNMTWAGVHQVAGKPILADTGYGVNGASAGPDPSWDDPVNINARIADGVVAISQYNPASSWGSTIAAVRPQLSMPVSCP